MKAKGVTLIINELEVSITVSIGKKSVDAVAYVPTTLKGQVSGISYGKGNWMGSAFFDERLGKAQADKVRDACKKAYDFAIACPPITNRGLFDCRIKAPR